MDDDLSLGLHVIKVLCLLVIAMSVHKLAFNNEFFTSLSGSGPISSSIDPRYNSMREVSGFNNAEAPVFWNIGDVESVDQELQTAASAGVDNSYSGFGNPSFDDQINKSLLGH